MSYVQFEESPISKFLFGNTKLGLLWLVLRLYVGIAWLEAGWSKFNNPAWTGDQAGAALTGFLNGALKKTSGLHPDVTGWYASLIQNVGLPNAETISYLVVIAELLVGTLLILGLFTGIAAFFGSFLNMNFLFAGTISINPVLFLIQLFLVLAWKTAGWWGLDRFLLPALGTPWQPGKAFDNLE